MALSVPAAARYTTAMTRLTMCVTGATDGIGFETALALAKQGIRVLVHGRTATKAEQACKALRERGAATAEAVWGDLASLEQTRALAEQLRAKAPVLDGLINNAGVFMKERVLTADGLETTFQVNHLAPYLLTRLLEGPLTAAPQGRVVNVSSMAHSRGRVDVTDLSFSKGFSGYGAYSATKLMNVHFTHELARRWKATRVTTYALHPGVIDTKLLRTGFGGGGDAVANGAVTSVFCATAPSLATVTGRYYSDGREARAAAHAFDERLEAVLWDESARLAGLA